MTQSRAKKLLPVIQAWAEGKAIQFRFHLGGEWTDAKADLEFADDTEYRIKPEPLTIWAIVYDSYLPNEAGIGVARVHKENLETSGKGGRIAKFVEVPQ